MVVLTILTAPVEINELAKSEISALSFELKINTQTAQLLKKESDSRKRQKTPVSLVKDLPQNFASEKKTFFLVRKSSQKLEKIKPQIFQNFSKKMSSLYKKGGEHFIKNLRFLRLLYPRSSGFYIKGKLLPFASTTGNSSMREGLLAKPGGSGSKGNNSRDLSTKSSQGKKGFAKGSKPTGLLKGQKKPGRRPVVGNAWDQESRLFDEAFNNSNSFPSEVLGGVYSSFLPEKIQQAPEPEARLLTSLDIITKQANYNLALNQGDSNYYFSD